MSDGSLLGWPVVEEEIARSTADRVDWTEYFGMSLSRWIAARAARGYRMEDAYKEASLLLAVRGVSDPELFKRLRVSVSARYSEAGTKRSAAIASGACPTCGRPH